MKIQVYYFAITKDKTGVSEDTYTVPVETKMDALIDKIYKRHPSLMPLKNCLRFALNESFVDKPTTLKDGDIVALIPPVTGG